MREYLRCLIKGKCVVRMSRTSKTAGKAVKETTGELILCILLELRDPSPAVT
jgi:hypothetical protein